MAVNLLTKNQKEIEHDFDLESVVIGHVANDMKWTGAQTITDLAIVTVKPGTYTRTGQNRYGVPEEVQDTKQTYTITQEKSNSLTVDEVNYVQQDEIKTASVVSARQTKEQYVPEFDKYCLNKFASTPGIGKSGAVTLSKDNILEEIFKAQAHMINSKVPNGGKTMWIKSSMLPFLLMTQAMTPNSEINGKAIRKGSVGEIADFDVIVVPDSYLPASVNFLCAKEFSLLAPRQIQKLKTHIDPPGLAGIQIDMLWVYDAFVREKNKSGVYKCVNA